MLECTADGIYVGTTYNFKDELNLVLEKAKKLTEKDFEKSIDHLIFKTAVQDLQNCADSVDNSYVFTAQCFEADDEITDEEFEDKCSWEFGLEPTDVSQIKDSIEEIVGAVDPGSRNYYIHSKDKEKRLQELRTFSRVQLLELVERIVEAIPEEY